MKSYIYYSTIIISLLLVLNPSYADSYKSHSYNDQARVIKVKPVYETVEVITPVEDCWEEKIVTDQNRHRPHQNYGGLVVGGIIGGVAGNQVGGGRGKKAATIAGSVIGAIIGDNVPNSNRHRHGHLHNNHHKKQIRYETHCDTIDSVTTREEIVAYRVEYRYKGHHFWTRTSSHPGKYIDVRVKVKPI